MSENTSGREATPEERQRILRAIESGQIQMSEVGERYLERAGGIAPTAPDFTVVEASVTEFWGPWETIKEDGTVQGNRGGIEISWGTESAGFGTLTLVLQNNGKLWADTEGMGKQFCKEVLAKLIDGLDEPD